MDSSIWYAKAILSKPEFSNVHRAVLEALTVLAEDYRLMKNNDSTLKYLELRVAMNDSLFNKEKARAIQNLTFNEEMQQQEIGDSPKTIPKPGQVICCVCPFRRFFIDRDHPLPQ